MGRIGEFWVPLIKTRLLVGSSERLIYKRPKVNLHYVLGELSSYQLDSLKVLREHSALFLISLNTNHHTPWQESENY